MHTGSDRPAAQIIPPWGGRLVDLLVHGEERTAAIARATDLASVQLSPRSMCDLELLATGAFSPLTRFMGRADYDRVLDDLRLADGTLFPIPITLPVGDETVVDVGTSIALRSPNNDLLAVMTIEEVFAVDVPREAASVYGTRDLRHPVVAELHGWGRTYVSGPLVVVNLPKHYDFVDLRRTPAQVRAALAARGYSSVVALHTGTPMRRVHEELARRAAEQIGGALLLHPAVGMTRSGDIEHYARIRAYRLLARRYFDPARTVLGLVPLATRMAGPREAVWNAIVRRNYGATHFLVEPDHASPGQDSTGRPFYGAQEAHALLARFQHEVGVTMVPFSLPHDDRGEADRPETAAIFAEVSPPRTKQGFCVWFTGLSGAGKSTIADILTVMLLERGRRVTVLDGDAVRTHLSKGLGFSKEDRDTNVRRIGFVAGEVVRHHGIVVCAAVSPFSATRTECRAMIGADRFVLVYVNTPLELCEQRDVKGMYAKARRGEIRGMTGIDDPYEVPSDADVVLTTTDGTPEEAARTIIRYLVKRGFLAETGDGEDQLGSEADTARGGVTTPSASQ